MIMPDSILSRMGRRRSQVRQTQLVSVDANPKGKSLTDQIPDREPPNLDASKLGGSLF
jgi:hypothetical protein